ncbi:MAG: carbonic anhydrase [Kineosporiaceae bacterium]
MSDQHQMPSPSPAAAWTRLIEGNARFVGGDTRRPHQDPSRRTSVSQGQAPFAVVLGCMDSRVPVEIVFDQGLGDLAVVRTAGHAVDNGVLGSLEFGVSALGAALVVVLGHDACGAVRATVNAHRTGVLPPGFVRSVVEHVNTSIVGALTGGASVDEADPDALGEIHVQRTVHLIAERSPMIGAALAAGTCAVVGAVYNLTTGEVRVVEAVGPVAPAVTGTAG